MVSLMRPSASCDKKHAIGIYVPKLICPSNSTYKPHVPITWCAHIWQLCQYICLIRTQCYQQCDQEHRCTYISHYWHMPFTRYACDYVHICPTVLLLWSTYRPNWLYVEVQKKKFATGTPQIAKYVPETNMPLKCHRYATYSYYFMCSIYKSYELTAINSVISSTVICEFHIFGIYTWKIYLPFNTCMYHCTNYVVYV